jgi:hypothetical protein
MCSGVLKTCSRKVFKSHPGNIPKVVREGAQKWSGELPKSGPGNGPKVVRESAQKWSGKVLKSGPGKCSKVGRESAQKWSGKVLKSGSGKCSKVGRESDQKSWTRDECSGQPKGVAPSEPRTCISHLTHSHFGSMTRARRAHPSKQHLHLGNRQGNHFGAGQGVSKFHYIYTDIQQTHPRTDTFRDRP